MYSFLSHLECTVCKKRFPTDRPANLCTDCCKVLFAKYNLDAASSHLTKDQLTVRSPNMWRYHEVLPIKDQRFVKTLGEGFTPLLQTSRLGERLDCANLFIKDEGVNPTGSFKARGLASAVFKANELGIDSLAAPSAGNAAGAMASYCAASGIEATVFLPENTPIANIVESEIFGAKVFPVKGSIAEAGQRLRQQIDEHGFFDLSTLKEPYRVEGKKTMGYELAEQLHWVLPDVIVYPAGGGTGLIGLWKAFDEMETMGWISSKRPRMVVVQADGCAPIVRAFQLGRTKAEPWKDPITIASGLRVPSPIGDYLMLNILEQSNGIALSVSDDDIRESVKEIAATEGIFACPEGGATLAALRKLLAKNKVIKDETIVLINTGSGLKYLNILN